MMYMIKKKREKDLEANTYMLHIMSTLIQESLSSFMWRVFYTVRNVTGTLVTVYQMEV